MVAIRPWASVVTWAPSHSPAATVPSIIGAVAAQLRPTRTSACADPALRIVAAQAAGASQDRQRRVSVLPSFIDIVPSLFHARRPGEYAEYGRTRRTEQTAPSRRKRCARSPRGP